MNTTPHDTVILGIAGSLRKTSINAALLRAAANMGPTHVRVEIASIDGIPLYDGDIESRDGLPDAVGELKERITLADGLLLVTPEYNRSIPGVFKNAIDWLSRPPSDIARVFGGRPVGLMGASPSPGGTRGAQGAWKPILGALGARLWEGPAVFVSSAHGVFDDNGNLVDANTCEAVQRFINGFSDFVKMHQAGRKAAPSQR